MQAIITNRPDDKDGVIRIYPETVEDVAQLETFINDGIMVSLRIGKFISSNKRVIYADIFYDRGNERKPT
uniref:Uncharacterized protein n=1 Tax=viral metagenome TaxID=1070528 RepID=A0A6M3KVA2_9ZZZZ